MLKASHTKNMISLIVILATSLIFLFALCGCGGKAQEEASGVGELKHEEVEKEPEGELEISRVTILKFGEEDLIHYRVIFFAGNSTDMICTGQNLTVTMYDAKDQVVGSWDASLGPVNPPGRWVMSDLTYGVPSEPVRAEVSIKGLKWEKITESTPRFQMLQANWALESVPGFVKVLGKFDYHGPALDQVKILAVLFDANDNPVGYAEGVKENVSEGTIPFEISLGNGLGETMSQNIKSVGVSFVW